jgi:hypothetical protein
MTKLTYLLYFRIILILSITLLWSCSSQPENPHFLVGAARKNITPEYPAFIGGGGINRQFVGVNDSLYAKAVVITAGKNSLAIVSLDNIGLLYPEVIRIRQEVAKRLAGTFFEPAHIVVTSTHTHSGPDVVGIWGPDHMTSGIDSDYLEWLVQQSASAIEQAWNNRQHGMARYAISEFGHSWVYNISDSASLDRSLNVLQFSDQEGQSIATLVNFACHPTILNGFGNLVSADFPGGMYYYLDENLGGINLFLQGAIGGWVQPEYESQSFETALQRGIEMGEAVKLALGQPTLLKEVELDFQSAVIQVPVSNPGFRQLSSMGVIKRVFGDSVETEIAMFRIGEAWFATHPGESTPVHSFATKALMPANGPKFIIGLGMDALGYILSEDFLTPFSPHQHIGYMLSMSVDPRIGRTMMETLESLGKRNGALRAEAFIE